MKVAVVGAGFSGCISALLLARKGAEVTLFDTQTSIGGVLRDIAVEGQRYFNGCHYLQHGWLDLLELTQGLLVFPHEYGALTTLGNKRARLLDDCAQPALDGLAQINANAILDGTALQRLSAYGPHATNLIAWASSFGNLAILDQRCLLHMQLSRIFFPEDINLLNKKKADVTSDQMIAVPRRIRQPESPIELAMLPHDGFNPFLDQIELALKNAGVKLKMNSPVKLISGETAVQLNICGQIQLFDKVVWASNPTRLLKMVCDVRLKTPPINMELFVGRFKSNKFISYPVPLPYYWQIFDVATPVVRVYVYSLQDRISFSVETFNRPGQNQHQVLLNIFHSLGLPTEFEIAARVKQLRHLNFSITEMNEMQASNATLLERGIIPGGWCHFGREEKITNINSYLDKIIL